MCNDRIVIPNTVQSQILGVIHHGHQGITKCNKLRKLFGVLVLEAIESLVGRCEECKIKKAAQRREPLISSQLPVQPWDCIGADLMDFKGKTFHVVMDYYSRYLEVVDLKLKLKLFSHDGEFH